jgi:type IV secretory pathway VirB2 component (pilin)
MFAIFTFLTNTVFLLPAMAADKTLVKDKDAIVKQNAINDFNEGTVNEADNNPLVDVLCQIVIFMQGRIGRAISLGVLFSFGILFFLGKVSWPQIVTMSIGLGLLFGAKSVALLVLPYYIEQDGDVQVTTSDAIKTVCPEI